MRDYLLSPTPTEVSLYSLAPTLTQRLRSPSPAATPSPLISVTFSGSFSLTGIPLSAYAGSVLGPVCVATLMSALSNAVVASAGCITCTSRITLIHDAGSTILYAAGSRRRGRALQSSASGPGPIIFVDYKVTGFSEAAVALTTMAASTNFSTAITTGVASTFPGVFAAMYTEPVTAAAASRDVTLIAIAASVALLLIIICFFLSLRFYCIGVVVGKGSLTGLTNYNNAPKTTKNLKITTINPIILIKKAGSGAESEAGVGLGVKAASSRILTASQLWERGREEEEEEERSLSRTREREEEVQWEICDDDPENIYYVNDETGETRWPEDMD